MDEIIRQTTGESSRAPDATLDLARGRRLPLYAIVGLTSMVVFEGLLFTGNWFVGTYFTPIQWTGLILFLDGVIAKRKGTSLLSRHRGEFFLLALISIGSWLIFEWYNTALGNWRYLNLPVNPWVRYSGYAWAFATISPGMFLIYETLSLFLPGDDHPHPRPSLPAPLFWVLVTLGFLCLTVPVVWPSPYMTPLVWMGFAFFLDPINGRLGERSILAEFFTGRFRSMPLFFLAGLIAGVLWEFWNYWAFSKWEYHVPYWGNIKVFEMPVLGFLGFMPFIIESFAIYKFVRRFLPIPIGVRYLG